MTTHSSILAWKIPWTEESGGLQSMGLQRVSLSMHAPWNRTGEWGGKGGPQCMLKNSLFSATQCGPKHAHPPATPISKCLHNNNRKYFSGSSKVLDILQVPYNNF